MFKRFILLFIVWIGLANSFDIQELIVGALVSFVIVYFFTKSSAKDTSLFADILKYLKFAPLFLKNLILSNIEIAKIVLSPKIKINQSIVKLEFDEVSDTDKLLISNAVTLTPGTITLDVTPTHIYIHLLTTKSEDKELLKDEILTEYINCCTIINKEGN